MNLNEAFEIIQNTSRTFPDEAIDFIKNHMDEAVPGLLKIIDTPFNEMRSDDDAAPDPLIAMFILAEFRIKKAFPYVMKYFWLSDDDMDLWLGDASTENFHVIVARLMSDQTRQEVMSVIESPDIDHFSKWTAIKVLLASCAWGETDYNQLEKYFESILEKYPEDEVIATVLACVAEEICTDKMRDLIIAAYEADIIDESMIDEDSFIFDSYCENKKKTLEECDHYKPSLATPEDMKSWAYYREQDDSRKKNTLPYPPECLYKESLIKPFIIRSEPVHQLRKIIDSYNSLQMSMASDGINLKDDTIKGMNDIKEKIYRTLSDYERFCALLLASDPLDNSLIRKCAESAEPIKLIGDLSKYERVLRQGIIHVFEYNGIYYALMCDEFKILYQRGTEDGILQKQKDLRHIKKYADAAANLYGAILFKRFVKIYKHYTQSKLSDDYILDILRLIFNYDKDCSLDTKLIVFTELKDGDPDLLEKLFADEQKERPLYMPRQSEFIKYADHQYREIGSGEKEMKRLLKICCDGIGSALVNQIVDELHDLIMGIASYDDAIDLLDCFGVDFNDMESREAFINLYNKMEYTTRKWENRGFTDKELTPREENAPVKKVKIGRNDPCPCGSGKKYKKCCGR